MENNNNQLTIPKEISMSEILMPGEEQPKNKKEENMDEEFEEKFFLMYHMNFQPSEVERLDASYRRKLIERFMVQKEMERRAIEQHRIMQQLGGTIPRND